MRSRIPITDFSIVGDERPVTIRHEEFRDDGVYTITWEGGHTTTTVLTTPKFEILAELAVEALCDRYHREAILTCASALDAYLDYHIEVTLRATGTTKEIVAELLKKLSRQAERRLGAFWAIDSVVAKKTPSYIPSSMVERRNEVVHKGYIPTEAEAIGYVQCVVEFISERYGPLYREHKKSAMDLCFEKMAALPPSKIPNLSHASLSMRTIVSALAFQNSEKCTFSDYLTKIKIKKQKPDKH